MTGTQSLIAILGVAAILGGTFVWKEYIKSQVKKRQLDHQVRMSELEKEKMAMVGKAAESSKEVKFMLVRMQKTQNEFLKCLDSSDTLEVNGENLVNGEVGKRLVKPLVIKPRRKSIVDRMDGTYMILSVDPDSVNDGLKAKVCKTDTKEKFTVDIPQGTLSPEQERDLRICERKKCELELRINIARIGNKVRKVTLAHDGIAIVPSSGFSRGYS